jgi:hypothetical protein
MFFLQKCQIKLFTDQLKVAYRVNPDTDIYIKNKQTDYTQYDLKKLQGETTQLT